MKYFLTLSEDAELDLRETNDYYSKISVELLDRFWEDLQKTMQLIGDNPLHYQERYRNNRIVFLKEFPFGLHYFINDNEVQIFRILHTKREF